MANSVFASILNSSVMLENYLQQRAFLNAFFSWLFNDKFFVFSWILPYIVI